MALTPTFIIWSIIGVPVALAIMKFKKDPTKNKKLTTTIIMILGGPLLWIMVVAAYFMSL